MRFVVRLAWLASALLPGALSTGNSTAIAPWVVWSAWSMVALASLVHHPISLTVIRFVGPMLVVHAASRSLTGGAEWGIVSTILQSIAVVAAFSATYGAVHAQASAYGHERRHLLRPPVAVILPLLLLWLLTVTSGGMVIAVGTLAPAATAAVSFVLLLGFSLRRSLVLAKRWLVFVPAGIALHDPLMLRDTFMVRTHDVRALRAAPANGEAFDATGTTWGTPLELSLSHPHDVSLSGFGARVGRTLDRLHVTALYVAPSRPDDVLGSLERPAVS